MVKLALKLRADLENIKEMSVERETFCWWLELKCSNCREDTGKMHDISLATEIPNRIGRGHVHYAAKCKLCSKEHSIEILPDSYKPYIKGSPLSAIVSFEFRNVEPVRFEPRDGWIAKSENSSQVFTDIDLTSGEWCDYDESAQEPVGIYGIEHEFAKV